MSQTDSDLYINARIFTKPVSFSIGAGLITQILQVVPTASDSGDWEFFGLTEKDDEADNEVGRSVGLANGSESVLQALIDNNSDANSAWSFYRSDGSEVHVDLPVEPLGADPVEERVESAGSDVQDAQISIRVPADSMITPNQTRELVESLSTMIIAHEITAAYRRDFQFGTPPIEKTYFPDSLGGEFVRRVGWLNAYPVDARINESMLPIDVVTWEANGYRFFQLGPSPATVPHDAMRSLRDAQESFGD